MIHFKHLQGNMIISTAGIGLGFASKKLLKKEFIPVSSLKQISISWSFLMAITVVGKIVMDKMAEKNLVQFTGKKKHPLEGFIGPLEKDDIFLTANRKNRQIIQDIKKDNRRN